MYKNLDDAHTSCVSYASVGASAESASPRRWSWITRKDARATLIAQSWIAILAILIVGACVLRARQLHSQIPDLYFLSVGNHCCSSPAQREVAAQMALIAEDYKTQFVMYLGDTFQNGPLVGKMDPGFKDLFTLYPSLHVPWYMAAGDEHKFISQIGITNISEFLIMPAPYFMKEISLPSGGSMDIIFLQTETLLSDQVQMQWLTQSLASSTANWCITVGYHPPEIQLRDALLPLFVRYGVNAYIYGHGYTAAYSEDAGIVYIGNGVGGCSLGLSRSQDQSLWSRSNYDGFMLHRVITSEMEFMFMDSRRNILQKILVKAKGRSKFAQSLLKSV